MKKLNKEEFYTIAAIRVKHGHMGFTKWYKCDELTECFEWLTEEDDLFSRDIIEAEIIKGVNLDIEEEITEEDSEELERIVDDFYNGNFL